MSSSQAQASNHQDGLLRARKNLHWQGGKKRKIEQALACDPIDLSTLKELSLSFGGLLNKQLRKKVWPKLLGVNVFYIPAYEGPPLINHKERPQVLLDIRRCGKRIPPEFTEADRRGVEDKLERVILRVLQENSELHYYQGLHDVVLTFLLEVGEEMTYAIMSVILTCHIRDFLDVDMSRTKVLIGCLSPLLAMEDPQLEAFITRSECAYYFSLSWLITWYGHVVELQSDAQRLTDVFLASHPLLPIYVAAAIVLTRRHEVLEVECELSAVHGLLSKLPPELKYEQMILLALQLFEKHPPPVLLANKHNYKLRHYSALIKSYPKFCRDIRYQRPDSILKHLPPPPAPSTWWPHPSTWWAWLLTQMSSKRTLLSILGPILIAMAIYFYTNSSYSIR